MLGVSRSPLSDSEFRDKVVKESDHLKADIDEKGADFVTEFSDKLFYHDLGSSYEDPYNSLADRINSLNDEYDTANNFIFYLSTPNIYEVIAKNLSERG